MALKDILVLMDKSTNVEDRLDIAIHLAKQHGARILGLNVCRHHLLSHGGNGGSGELQQSRELFERKISLAGIDGEWQNIDVKGLRGSVADAVNHHAHFADLVVVGQAEPDSSESDSEANLPERVVLGSGKPVLILPYAVTYQSCGDKVLVAWKSGRESSRAVADALPVLRKAHKVSLFEVNPTEPERVDMESLCSHLERHGVQAKVETSRVTKLAVGDVLLNRLSDEGSDLLVMGAFAHTHFGVYAIGEVARHVLKHMTVPVLMSH